MACSPAHGHPLTQELRALACQVEDTIDQAIAGQARAPYYTVRLSSLPPDAAQREIRYRYLSAGWSRVIFHERASDGAAVVELHALRTVRLAKEPA